MQSVQHPYSKYLSRLTNDIIDSLYAGGYRHNLDKHIYWFCYVALREKKIFQYAMYSMLVNNKL